MCRTFQALLRCLQFRSHARADRVERYRAASKQHREAISVALFVLAVVSMSLEPRALAGKQGRPGSALNENASPLRGSPAVKHFVTLPPHAHLPAGRECAAEIPLTPETIPNNTAFNHTTISSAELAAFAARGYTFERLLSYSQYARITGNYAGSTDMIMRWAACKYGIEEDVVRGQAWQESWWEQWHVGDKRSRKAQCIQGSFTALWNASIQLVNGRSISCPHCCWTSWSAWQTKVYYEWKTWPMIKDSTSFAAEYRFADTRSCMNGDWVPYFAGRPAEPGHDTYSRDLEKYASDPDRSNLETLLWGCIGVHYSGGWYDAGAIKYIADIRGDIAHRRWVTPGIHITGP